MGVVAHPGLRRHHPHPLTHIRNARCEEDEFDVGRDESGL
jgi:hypothetical protein